MAYVPKDPEGPPVEQSPNDWLGSFADKRFGEKDPDHEVKVAGFFDTLGSIFGLGSKPSEAKPTPEPVGKPITSYKPGAMKEYTSDADAEFAKASGFGYGTVHEPYINNQVAKVYGEIRTKTEGKGKNQKTTDTFYANTADGKTVTQVLNAVNDRTKSVDIDLTKPEFKAVRDRIGLAYTKAALAVEANPIAKLGYDPKLVMSDVSGDKTNLSGAYRAPLKDKAGNNIENTEGIYANLTDPSVFVHESTHRGLRMLAERNPEAREIMNKIPELPGTTGHEGIVRYLMVKHAGDPEKIGPSGNEDRQRKEALEMFDDKFWGKQHRQNIDKLMALAAQEVMKKSPGGPR
jgi:hypothetical protein